MTFRLALERLLAFDPKRLLRGRYWDGNCGCFIGVVCPHTRPGGIVDEWEAIASDAEMTLAEFDLAIQVNDGFKGSEEDRYEYMAQWCRDQVAKDASQ